jgi:hypothetical protein
MKHKECFEDFGNLRINLFDNTNQEEFMKLKVKKLRGVSNG